MKDTTPLSIKLRSGMFFLLYNLIGIFHSFLCVLVGPFLPFKQRYHFINLWTRASLFLLRHLNGVTIQLEGEDNLPSGGYVVLANHQSSFETFYLQLVITPQATVLKKELLWLPFFGWGLALLKPITIDRSKGTTALKSVLQQGKAKLNDCIPVVIYPEGTRQPAGKLGKFNHGGSMLACQADVPVVAISHNFGKAWPAKSWLRFPGTVTLRISRPIQTTKKKPQQVTQEVEAWIKQNYPN